MGHHPSGCHLSLEIRKAHPNIFYFTFKTLGNINRWHFPTSRSDVCHAPDEEVLPFIGGSLAPGLRDNLKVTLQGYWLRVPLAGVLRSSRSAEPPRSRSCEY